MAEDKDQDKNTGPLAKYLAAAKLLGVLVGIGLSLYGSCKAQDGVDRAKVVSNANAGMLEHVIVGLLKDTRAMEDELRDLKKALGVGGIGLGALAARGRGGGGPETEIARVEVEDEALRDEPRRVAKMLVRAPRRPARAGPSRRPDAGIPDLPKPDVAQPKPRDKPRPPVKFKLQRMQVQVQTQDEL